MVAGTIPLAVARGVVVVGVMARRAVVSFFVARAARAIGEVQR
jgi:hypothetical protein